MNDTTVIRSYEIHGRHNSESAYVFFVRRKDTNENLVIKILRPFEDTRYNLKSGDERRRCQLEALKWNSVFTQNVYLGLARIYTSDSKLEELQSGGEIDLGEATEESKLTEENLDSGADYALLMYRLPDSGRLDVLLEQENENVHLDYAKHVIDRVIEVHKDLPLVTLTDENETDEDECQWGSTRQLEEKLKHNLYLFDSKFPLGKYDAERSHSWQEDKSFLQQVLAKGRFPEYFQQRVRDRHIKRCHGDLKAPNIWITPGKQLDNGETAADVMILDAIDFNPTYCNIDVLSDIALLITDAHARTKSRFLADQMIEYYLEKTNRQKKEACKAVLAFYLVEKAVFSAAIIYLDEKPDRDLASSFWEVAKMRLEDLKREVQSL